MAQGNNNNPNNNRFAFVQQLLMMFLVYYFFFGNRQQPQTTNKDSQGNTITVPNHAINLKFGTPLDLWVYISESETDPYLDKDGLIWHEKNIIFGNWDDKNTREKTIMLEITNHLLNNGSLYAHSFFMAPKKHPQKAEPLISIVHNLVKYLPKSKVYERKNLISGEVDPMFIERQKLEKEKNIPNEKRIISHWKENFTLNVVQDQTVFPSGGIPDPLRKYIKLDDNGNYYPILYANDFWLLDEDLKEINDTVKNFTLHLKFEPLSLIKFTMFVQMEAQFDYQRSMLGGSGDFDEFKRILTDNNPYILLLTAVISVLHTVLDVLAFKNEIQFWRNRKSLEGLSVRTIYINLISSIIIMLYILDHEETSWIIIVNVVLSVLIELWKITKAAKVSLGYWNGIPYPVLTDKQSYTARTKEHDLTAMKYLYYSLYPIVIGYAIYSLYYENHKSWYSWIVGSLAGCVYTFGFIMMTPQLFINWKLKSVAHLPWRTFVYKAINTFIDDLFAFLIRMPTMHRLRVFRDDIVFLIYLYQRWIYPVDKGRLEVGGEFEDVSVDELKKAMEEEQQKNQKNNQDTNTENTQDTNNTGEKLKTE